MKTKVCINKDCEFQNKPQSINEFEFRKDTNKYRNQCKSCCKKQSAKRQSTYRKKHNVKWDTTYYKKSAKRQQYVKEYNKNYKKSPAKYKLYSDKLIGEQIRKDPNNQENIQVRCAYCGKWYVPTTSSCINRIKSIDGKGTGTCRFYCSRSCKEQCPSYKKKEWPKGYKKATSREVNPEFRKIILERDNWICQRCSSQESLHCHHIKPRASNPLEESDPDNGITFCKSCHIWIHTNIPGCGHHEIKCKDNDIV